jgi:predicted Zn finger-like uncharacterized protein
LEVINSGRKIERRVVMIIECDNCRTTFNLEENLLGKEGSKVRCSICRHVFFAYPPHISAPEDEFQETVALDSPFLEKGRSEASEDDGDLAFDEILDESLEEDMVASAPATEGLEDFGVEEDRDELDGGEIAVDEMADEEPLTDSPEMGRIFPLERESGKSRTLLVILVVLFLLVGAGAALVRWAPQLLPDFLNPRNPQGKASVADQGIRRLSFKAVTGSFFTAKKAGRLFVIRGMVTNNYPKSHRFVLIKGTILDDKGVVVREKVAYAGNALSEEELNQRSLAELDSAMKNRKNSEVAPDESVPFTIIFEGLPENLSEFTVEAVSSSPVE